MFTIYQHFFQFEIFHLWRTKSIHNKFWVFFFKGYGGAWGGHGHHHGGGYGKYLFITDRAKIPKDSMA